MGLFSKKASIDPKDFLALRAELIEMKARLDDSEQSRAVVESRLSALDASTTALASMPAAGLGGNGPDVAALAGRLQQLETQTKETRVQAPAGIGITSMELNAKVDALHNRMLNLPDHSSRISQLELQLNTVDGRIAEIADVAQRPLPEPAADAPPMFAPPSGPDPETVARIDAISQKLAAFDELTPASDELRQQIAMMAERMAAGDTEARITREQVTALEQRVTSVGTELANQISELGRDIDSLAEHPASEPSESTNGIVNTASDEMIETLKSSQVKLANEQARYEIAFREDLAALAEQVRKANGR